MGYRTNNLNQFNLDSVKDYIDMWHELDQDYAEDNYVKDKSNLEDYSYNSEAEKIIRKLFNEEWNDSDYSRVEYIMQLIKQGHGDFSTQFKFIINETENHDFYVAVSYLT